jgi:preprotein translocase subunit SecF
MPINFIFFTCLIILIYCLFSKRFIKAINSLMGLDHPQVEEAKVEEAKVEEAKVEEAKVEEAKVEGVGAKNLIKKEAKQAVKKIAKRSSEANKELKNAQKKRGYRK